MDIIENKQITFAECLAHWYYLAKFMLLKRALRKVRRNWNGARVADVGCGMGVFLSLLARDESMGGMELLGVDPGHTQETRVMGLDIPVYPNYPDARPFDVILLMDVLEHVPDPEALLAAAVSRCKPGGLIFITVPAHQWLWSAHDEFLGHYRRYNLKSLRQLTGIFPMMRCLNAYYFYASILPAVMLFRLLCKRRRGENSDLQKAPAPVNAMLLLLLKLELCVASLNKLAGVTAVCMLKKAE